MGRLHSHRHGKSHSIRPASPARPGWASQGAKEVEALATRYAKEGLSPSHIGVKLRDQHAIPTAKQVAGKPLAELLGGAGPELPEDLDNMVKKAVGLQRHLRNNKGDRRNVRSLELIEAKVHRLDVYYKRTGRIPKNWKYKSTVAQLE